MLLAAVALWSAWTGELARAQPAASAPAASKTSAGGVHATGAASDQAAAIVAPPDVAAPPKDAQKTPSGLYRKRIRRGRNDEVPRAWDRIELAYTGWTPDGVMFDSTRQHHEPVELRVDQLIPGWREAVLQMRVGEIQRLWVSEELAYQGRAGVPRGMLVFEIELLEIDRLPEPPRPPKDLGSAPSSAARTGSGLACRVLKRGRGTKRPTFDSRVRVHYSIWTQQGELFDSSVVRNQVETLAVATAIPGWAEALQRMAVGEKTRCWIPGALAYEGVSDRPQGLLVYDTELLGIEPTQVR